MRPARTWFPLTGPVPSGPRAMAAVKKPGPIDPLTGPKQALAGRVVTMDDAFTVRPDGIVYIDQGCIVAVQDRAQAAPAAFAGVPVVETGGTIFPGLIELHNHLSYNVLPLWSPVPKRFQHRDQWSVHKDYRPMISGPMTVIGEHRDSSGQSSLLAALVRYVECKCLLGGVTTTPGRNARQQRRQSSASIVDSYATSSRPTIRPCRRRRAASPMWMQRKPVSSRRASRRKIAAFCFT